MLDINKVIIALGAVLFVTILFKKLKENKTNIYYEKNGAIYLGFLGVGVITVMDVLTSVFYAPAESYRFVGYDTMLFMPMTALAIAGFAFSMVLTIIAGSLLPTLKAVIPLSAKSNFIPSPSLFL